MTRFASTFALVFVTTLAAACKPVDSGVNPPPHRTPAGASERSGAAVPAARGAASSASDGLSVSAPAGQAPETAPEGRPVPSATARAPDRANTPPAPQTPPVPSPPVAAPGKLSHPSRPEASARDAVVLSLLDALDPARVRSPHIDGQGSDFEVLPEGKRSFANPWVPKGHGKFDRRVVWTDGSRNEWALRSALTLPVPAEVTWELDVPAAAAFTTDVAMGTRVSADGPVTLEVRVTADGETRSLSKAEYSVGAVHKLKAWTPLRVDLSAFAGKRVTLGIALSTSDGGRGYRYTAFLSQPTIVSSSPEAAKAATGLGKPPNILLLIIDAQRADTIGHNREKRGVLPALFPTFEKVVADGTELTQTFSVGNQTRLSTYSFLAGQYPTYGGWHLARWNYPPEVKAGFYARNPPLITQLLRKLGYRTGSVSNNLFLFGSMDVSLDVGFDTVTDHRHGTMDTVWITESAKAWLTRHKDERWFLMVNYNGPHDPYQPPKSVMEELTPKLAGVEGYSSAYLGELEYTDDYAAQLLSHLDTLGLAEDTILVLTADHGEIMDPRHQCYADNWDSNCLHNHGKTLFDEETHVPLAFRWPGVLSAGKKVDAPNSQIDLVPTLLGLIGAPIDGRLLGRDLSDAVLGDVVPDPVPIVCEARLSSALRWKGFKYIIHDSTERIDFDNKKTLYDRRRTKEELYDLVRDPGELQSLVYGDVACGGPGSADPNATSCDAILKQMRDTLRTIRDDLGKRRGEIGMNAAPETLQADAGEPDGPAPDAEAGAAPSQVVASAPDGGAAVTTAATAGGETRSGAVQATSGAPSSKDALIGTRPTPAVKTAWIHVRLHGPGAFGGSLSSSVPFQGLLDATVTDGSKAPTGASLSADGRTISVTSSAGLELRIGLAPEARLTVALTRDGAPLTKEQLYVGPYGLCLLEPPFEVEVGDLGDAESPRAGPPSLEVIAPGAFLWADTGAGKLGAARAEKADDIDEEVRGMMKEWGYTGK